MQDKIILKEHIIPIMKKNSADNVSAVYASSINPGFMIEEVPGPHASYMVCVLKKFSLVISPKSHQLILI